MEQEEIAQLLQENLRLTREMHGVVKKIHHHMIWERVKFFVKLAVLLVVLYVGYATLPAILERYVGPYRDVLNKLPNVLQQLQNISHIKLPSELKQLLPKN